MIEAHTDWIEVAEFGFELISALCVGVVTWVNWGLRAVIKSEMAKATLEHDEVHEELERRLGKSAERFARIETHLGHLPTRSDIEALNLRLGQISADIAAVGASVKALGVQVHQLSEHAMERK